MGKGTDKLYVGDARFSAEVKTDLHRSHILNGARATNFQLQQEQEFVRVELRMLPFADCPDGQIFDHENIIRWLLNHDTNPTNGKILKQSDLIKLNFAQNEVGGYVDPVTFKEFTENSHIVAIRHGESANVFLYDTLERLNFKAKMWRDLVSDEEFSKKDLIVLQDPQNLESRNLSSFKYLKDGEDSGVPKEQAGVNISAMGNAAKILKAKEAVAKARAEKAAGVSTSQQKNGTASKPVTKATPAQQKATPYNATRHTTGLAAASLTSTGVTPHTSGALALMSDEEYLLKRGRVKQKGYIRLETSLGDLTIEVYPEHAPKASWNFVKLAKQGYYNGINFHRNIRNFMIQGGDPTGTGKGGTSIWNKNFEDEFDSPLKHDVRGMVSMANKGKNTNSSQFFITYRKTPHLDRKHTIFGKVIDSEATLKKLEEAEVEANDRPKEEIVIEQAVVYTDPFDEFQKERKAAEEIEQQKEEQRQKGTDDDNRTTWTGKRVRADGTIDSGETGVGKYLKAKLASEPDNDGDEIVEFIDEEPDSGPVRKKAKGGGGFGSFDGW